MENTIAVVADPLFLQHRAPEGHPERPERLGAAEAALANATGHVLAERLAPRDASPEEMARVHDPKYLERLAGTAQHTGYLDPDTFFGPLSYAAARRAAGGCVGLVDALLDGRCSYGVGLVRPPGHHARPAAAMGFCLLNNVAIAAAHARARGAARVAIIDWDVHHGNGTQEVFYGDPSVLYLSLHQFPFYPGTGDVEETGRGEGVGATVNVPLSAGAGDAAYLAAFDRIVGPSVEGFDPDLVLISAGFDAHRSDPLAAMRLTEAGYAKMTRRLCAAIPRGAAGRLGLVLEGGYDLAGLGSSLQATVEALITPGGPGPGAPVGPVAPVHETELHRALTVARRRAPLG
jgi:acetoin utilization deacetylase AcuC-like enzyme